jgi:RimJ/RimL family protein N-acetyltransferase
VTYLTMRAYVPSDFIEIETLAKERKLRDGQPVEVWAEIHAKAGPAFTFIDDDEKIVFCCGISTLWPGVGEVWATFSPLARKYPYTWQAFKWSVKQAFTERWGYWRIQAILDCDDEDAIRMDEKVGFKREGIMRHYGPHGEDSYMYALIGKDG